MAKCYFFSHPSSFIGVVGGGGRCNLERIIKANPPRGSKIGLVCILPYGALGRSSASLVNIMSPLAISTIIVICGPSVQEANWNSMDGFEREITLKREITDVGSRKCREENGQEREHCKTLNTRQRAVSFNDPLHSSTACSFFLRPLLPCKHAWNVAEGGRGWVVDRVGVPYGMRFLLSKADLSNK